VQAAALACLAAAAQNNADVQKKLVTAGALDRISAVLAPSQTTTSTHAADEDGDNAASVALSAESTPSRLVESAPSTASSDDDMTALRLRAVQALSCTIRGDGDLIKRWCEASGPASLASALTTPPTPTARFMVKVASFLAALPVDCQPFADAALDTGLTAVVRWVSWS